jgi:uncharacterized membrane protein HdeD (DUF308 family)
VTREPYQQVRVRPLQLLSWVVVSIGVVMVLLAVVYLLAGADPGAVLLLLLLPALLMTGLAAWSISLLTRNHRRARLTVPATGAVTVLVGIMYSRIGPGVLITVAGLLLLFFALLPARESEPDPPSDG